MRYFLSPSRTQVKQTGSAKEAERYLALGWIALADATEARNTQAQIDIEQADQEQKFAERRRKLDAVGDDRDFVYI